MNPNKRVIRESRFVWRVNRSCNGYVFDASRRWISIFNKGVLPAE